MECTVRLGRGTGASVREDVGLAFGGVRSEALREGLLSAKNLGATAHSGSTGGQRHPSSITRGSSVVGHGAVSRTILCVDVVETDQRLQSFRPWEVCVRQNIRTTSNNLAERFPCLLAQIMRSISRRIHDTRLQGLASAQGLLLGLRKKRPKPRWQITYSPLS